MGNTDKTVASPTEYVLLHRQAGIINEADWQVVTESVSARSATEAIRHTVALLAPDDQAGVFVAVPARSWKPVTVHAEVQTRLKLESA